MVCLSGLGEQLNRIVMGSAGFGNMGIVGAFIGIASVFIVHVLLARYSHTNIGNVEKFTHCLPGRLSALAFARKGLIEKRDNLDEQAQHLSNDVLRVLIGKMLVDDGLKTQMAPFPETRLQFDAILGELRQIEENVLEQKLVISGFAAFPVEEQECSQCMYYLAHRKWCDLPELSLPVEPNWWCRLWRI